MGEGIHNDFSAGFEQAEGIQNNFGPIPATVISGTAKGWFYGSQTVEPDQFNFGVAYPNTDLKISACLLILPIAYVINKVAVNCITGAGGATPGYLDIAIYTIDGNLKVLDAGAKAFTNNISLNPQVKVLPNPVSIPAGAYLFAWGGAKANNGGRGTWQNHIWVDNHILDSMNVGSTVYGTAANPINVVDGSMPTTLGALTAYSAADADQASETVIPFVKFIP